VALLDSPCFSELWQLLACNLLSHLRVNHIGVVLQDMFNGSRPAMLTNANCYLFACLVLKVFRWGQAVFLVNFASAGKPFLFGYLRPDVNF
jgi:hypothetical protein